MDMDSVINQKRASCSNTGAGGQARKTVTFFKEDDYSVHSLGQITDHEFATSVAAAAYAVHLLDTENSNYRNGKTLAKERSLKRDDQFVPLPRSKIIASEIESTNSHKDGKGSAKKPSSEAPLARKPFNVISSSSSKISTNDKIDAWERNEVEKVKKRYANIRSRIQTWDDDKKTKAKIELQKKKIELDCKKERNHQHYKFQIERINAIRMCASAEMLKKAIKEETAVKERAKKIRTGRGAAYFLCC